ncbi:PAS domain-containing protein [Streptomyces sp. BE20]|uniref:PAS domain-containing protein n=1 Tax=Streptomyces sp. BE20 TaxID=3002525 RepID=UPI003FA7E6A3
MVAWSFTQSPDRALALYDTRLRLRLANEDMERYVALSESDMRGLRVNEIVDDDAGDRAEQAMLRVLETGKQHIETGLPGRLASTPGRSSCRRYGTGKAVSKGCVAPRTT